MPVRFRIKANQAVCRSRSSAPGIRAGRKSTHNRGGTCGSLGGDLELISLYAAATGCYNRANAAESLEPESRNRDGAPPIDFW